MKILTLILLPLTIVFTYIYNTPQNNSNSALSKKHVNNSNTPEPSFDLELKSDSSRAFPAILVKENDSSAPIKMSELKIHSEITGNLSYVTYDMTFYNDQDRILEGELYFPLGEGQSVSNFELEVNGKMREAVIVEKTKGRIAFESTVRAKVDPGLIEWTKGSSFKTRIYPIPAKGYKRVIIGFYQELQLTDNGALFNLPMNFKDQVEAFEFTAVVIQQTKIPLIPEKAIKLDFTPWQDNFKTSASKKNYTPNENIAFYIPFVKADNLAWRYQDPISKQFFYYGVIEQIVTETNSKSYNTMCIVLDASHSQRNKDIEQELKVLDAFISKNNISSVTLKTLRNDYQFIAKASWSDIKSKIRATVRDGGTQFGSIIEKDNSFDVIFLLSDGIQTFGKLEPSFGNNTVITINSNKEANHGFLRNLCQSNGGRYINMQNTNIEDACTTLLANTPSLSLHLQDGSEYSSTRYQIKNNKIYHTFSFLASENMENINYTLGNGTKGKIETKSSSYANIKKICGQRITEDWADLPTKTEEIIQIGKSYHIVTPNTSLIVLDRVEDYVMHEIVPPTELLKAYNSLLATTQQNEKSAYDIHIKKVVSEIESKMKWYHTNFDWKKLLEQKKDKINSAESIQHRETLNEVVEESIMMDMDENPSAASYSISVDNDNVTEAVTDANFGYSANKLDDSKESFNKKGKEINIETWSPDTPYLTKLKETKSDKYETYISLKKEYQDQPSFYLDVVEYFIEKDQKSIAIRVLSNIAEMELENHQLLRILAHRLEQLEENELAYLTYLEVEKIREEEPQSYRDLGLICNKLGRHQEAINYLNHVATTVWDTRFPNIEVIVASEMSKIISEHPELDLLEIDSRMITKAPMDLRIVVDWDANNCDIDLWVTDPLGEKCLYSNKQTKAGGWMSSDFTGGYGPEEFVIKTGPPGEYKVELNYYGSTQQTVAGPTTIMVKLYTNYGTPTQELKEITRRVSSEKEVLLIGSIVL
jgi:tetratricopeptide (TPR) repeat protein